jgi:hypothetical protein
VILATLATVAMIDLAPLKVGQAWDYTLSWRYVGDGMDTTDEESFKVEVAKVLKTSYAVQISQRLEATLVEGERIPVSAKNEPIKKDWALFSNGALAFYPDGRFPLETRFYRVLQAILPAPAGSSLRESSWSQVFEDDGFGMPRAAVYGNFSKRTKDGDEFKFSYREGKQNEATNATGLFVRSNKAPFPVSLRMQFVNVTMPGGNTKMDAWITLILKKPEKPAEKADH